MGWTSIPVKTETKERLVRHDEKDGRDWDTFLRRELLGENIDGDPVDITIEVGDVVRFSTPMQMGLYAKRVSEVGPEAVYWRHSDSKNHVLGSMAGEIFLAGLVHGPYPIEFVNDPFDNWGDIDG